MAWVEKFLCCCCSGIKNLFSLLKCMPPKNPSFVKHDRRRRLGRCCNSENEKYFFKHFWQSSSSSSYSSLSLSHFRRRTINESKLFRLLMLQRWMQTSLTLDFKKIRMLTYLLHTLQSFWHNWYLELKLPTPEIQKLCYNHFILCKRYQIQSKKWNKSGREWTILKDNNLRSRLLLLLIQKYLPFLNESPQL